MIITIDGPSASGKSTVAKALAKKLGFYYLYTGLLYRAVAYIFFVKLKKTEADLVNADFNFIKNITYKYMDNQPVILVANKNITNELFASTLAKGASVISADPHVREGLLELQRMIARKYDIVADGRDCGSTVFPDAKYKFFLTASIDIRAKRAFFDVARKNTDTLEDVKKSLEERDKRDKERKVSPLVIPKDAIIIDNSNLDIRQTLEKFLSYIK